MDAEDKRSDPTKAPEIRLGSGELQASQLEAWLREMPREWVQAIGARIALRVLPLLGARFRDDRAPLGPEALFLSAFCASFISWAASKYPNANIGAAARYAAHTGVSERTAADPAGYAAVTAFSTAAATADSNNTALQVVHAIGTAFDAARAAGGEVAVEQVWNSITADATWLAHNTESEDDPGIRAQQLINESLWLEEVRGDRKYKANFPRWAREPFDAFATSELVRTGKWKPWVDWYRAILPSSRTAKPQSAFGERTDIEIATQARAFWERDPNEVMADIDKLVRGGRLAGEPAAVSAPGNEIFRYAKTLSDLDHRNDFIGIRPDVEALSTLVAINRVEPPLAIAIFGDWGSGKTFLMRKMQERIQVLEEIGAAQQRGLQTSGEEVPSDDGDEEPRYCSSILQIEFNAWHYTESNLWASLVSYIFEKLQERLTGTP